MCEYCIGQDSTISLGNGREGGGKEGGGGGGEGGRERERGG